MISDSLNASISATRVRWLLIFLWLSIFAWGIVLGAKLFYLLVLVSAWSANPPTSLSLLPYGPQWPSDPGDFFAPLMLLIVVGLVGALISGWNTQRTFKVWLWVPLIAFFGIAVTTPTFFWPMIRDLYDASTGVKPLSDAAVVGLVNKYIVYDWGRTALAAVGFTGVVRAMSITDRMKSV